MLDKYFPRDRVALKVYPMEMRYGGRREAVLHAIIRQNFGCSRLIVGRDHAGVGKYYGPFDAQKIFDKLPEGALQIKPLKLDWTFWCYTCGGMASMKTCTRAGILLAHPDKTKVLTRIVMGQTAKLFDPLSKYGSVSLQKLKNGKKLLLVYFPVDRTDWVIDLQQSIDEAYLPMVVVILRSIILI